MFETSDGVRLSGRLFGPPTETAVDAGIVFAHMLPADQSSWYGEAIRYAEDGYLALTFNLRGYCPGGAAGCSLGEKDPSKAAVDLAAAVDHLRSTGMTRVALIGASVGGTAALVESAADPDAIEAVITLSAPVAVGGLSASPDVVAQVRAAKLFIAGTGDGVAVDAAESLYQASGQPKRLEILPSDDHGTDMLQGNAGGRVRDLMDLWLGTYLPLSSPAQPTAAPS